MNENIWYAVQIDEEDNDWGTGSHNYNEAVEKARRMGPEARIAVIELGNDPICTDVIMQEDF